MKFLRYIFSSTLVFGLLTLASCNDDLVESPDHEEPSVSEDDMVDLTLSIGLFDLESAGTRGSEGEEGVTLTDEKLKNLDLLVYALRDADGNLLYQYGRGLVNPEGYFNPDKENGDAAFKNYSFDTDNNQTLMKATWEKVNVNSQEETYRMKEKITLRVMRGTLYKLSVWVQSKDCGAYDFNNFTVIKANYEGAKNNDENLDAFCATSTFSIGQMNSEITMTLTRPFAQINVGVLVNESNSSEYEKYQRSQIELENVAKYFNLVDNKVWTQAEIHNYISSLEKPEDSLFKGEEDSQGNVKALTNATFLYNDLPTENGKPMTFEVRDFQGWGGGTITPTSFYSLSTCYVLVPESVYNMDENGGFIDGGTAGSGNATDNGVVAPSLNNVYIKLRSFSIEGSNNTEVGYPPMVNGQVTPLEIGVKRNWRSNILFGDWSKFTSTGSQN